MSATQTKEEQLRELRGARVKRFGNPNFVQSTDEGQIHYALSNSAYTSKDVAKEKEKAKAKKRHGNESGAPSNSVESILGQIASYSVSDAATQKEEECEQKKTDVEDGVEREMMEILNELVSELLLLFQKKQEGEGSERDAKESTCRKIMEILKKPVSVFKKEKIIPVLDRNWKGVAMKLGFSSDDIKCLRSCQAGGSSPALSFFETLCERNHYQTPVKDLKECFTKLEMSKALDVINSYPDDTLLGDLPPLIRHDLARVCESAPEVKGSDWHSVSEYFGMGNLIPQFENSVKQNNKYSPGREMFEIINIKYSDRINIGVFYKAIKEERLIAITRYFDEQIKEMVKKDSTNH